MKPSLFTSVEILKLCLVGDAAGHRGYGINGQPQLINKNEDMQQLANHEATKYQPSTTPSFDSKLFDF